MLIAFGGGNQCSDWTESQPGGKWEMWGVWRVKVVTGKIEMLVERKTDFGRSCFPAFHRLNHNILHNVYLIILHTIT